MKILLLSLSAGSGHVRAADAILKTSKQQYPNIDIEHIDIFNYISNPFKRATVDAYDLVIKNSPELWGLLYKHSNNAKLLKIVHKYSKKIKNFNTKKLNKYLKEYQPTHIISTNFLCTDLYLSGREKHGCSAPVSTVITDYQLHELWLINDTHHYFVPTKEIKQQMIERGINKNTITISGIPVDPIFYKNNVTQSFPAHQLGRSSEKPNKQHYTNILVMSGGQGLGQADKIVKALINYNLKNLNITAIAGKNKKLKTKLEELNIPNLTVVGWTNKIDEYMRQSDVIISKPGGMTTTECMTLGKPLIAIDPIPGQEEANANYIEKNEYGYIANSLDDIPKLIKKVIQQQNKKSKKQNKKSASIILNKIIS